MSTLRVNTIQDTAGSGSPAINGLARAWVNFTGQSTPTIRASYNVSSITDNGGSGDYTINFTTALPDAKYAVACICSDDNSANRGINIKGTDSAMTTSGFRINIFANADPSLVSAIVFR